MRGGKKSTKKKHIFIKKHIRYDKYIYDIEKQHFTW